MNDNYMQNIIKVQVSCIAIKDNKIAMVKKVNKNYSTFNQYIPPGGHVENFENLEDACSREVQEETGLSVSNLELKGVVTFKNYIKNTHSVCFFFLTNDVTGKLISNEIDKQTSHWINLTEVFTNKSVPIYHKAFLKEMLINNRFINGKVITKNEGVEWSV
ncbi:MULTISPECIES: NUDIX domain-containing protein [unclassified Lysinibacillus]|uniref:NUDIX domain-containing protein n=1 Tax=unclassified Lysinibacillus TaxID=2636778 RepID=UPI00382A2644